jgi:hypothetical protein
MREDAQVNHHVGIQPALLLTTSKPSKSTVGTRKSRTASSAVNGAISVFLPQRDGQSQAIRQLRSMARLTSVSTRNPAANTRTCYRWGTTTAAAIPRRRRPAAPGRRRPTGRSASRRASAAACPATATSPVERPAVHADGDQHAAHLGTAPPAPRVAGRRPACGRCTSTRAARQQQARGQAGLATRSRVSGHSAGSCSVRAATKNRAPPRPRPVRPAVRDRAAPGPSRPRADRAAGWQRAPARSGRAGHAAAPTVGGRHRRPHRLVPRPSGAQAEQVQQETALEETSGIR